MSADRARGARTYGPVGLGVATLVGIGAPTAAGLRAMGRTVWCSCGSPVPWSWDIWSKHNSQHLVDPYTFTHVLHGFVFYALSAALARVVLRIATPAGRSPRPAGFALAVAMEAVWELFENTNAVIERYREATISLDYFGDSVINSMGDLGACALGFGIVARLPTRASIALFLATEAALLATIRDSLTLNVLMLVLPGGGLTEAIQAWQTAGR